MNTSIKKAFEEIRFICPDDGENLLIADKMLICKNCGREYPIIDGCFISLLPKTPKSLERNENADYYDEYVKTFYQSNSLNDEIAWGAPESVPLKWKKTREGQVERVFDLLNRQPSLPYVCDFSAGSGYYTLKYAKNFSLIIHCDLSIQNLQYCRKKASSSGIDNILFIRMDYFNPPFRNSLKNVICFDTLIRGEEHEKELLRSIYSSLTIDGIAFLDFHNWWHNPLRRIGILKNNFGSNRSYTKRQASKLIEASGLSIEGFSPFWQEIYIYKKNIFKLLPPTRLIFKVKTL